MPQSSMTTTEIAATVAEAPFNDRQADIILRTSDNVNFYAFKLLLSLASPAFKHMFSPSSNQSNQHLPGAIVANSQSPPIFPLSEDSQIIDYLLRVCYPVIDPTPSTSLTFVAKVLGAALKYKMEKAVFILRAALRTFASAEPLRVYAIACRLALESEAGVAAQVWRDRLVYDASYSSNSCQSASHHTNDTGMAPCNDRDCKFRIFEETTLGSSYVAEFKDVLAGCYYRLMRFVRTGQTTQFVEPIPTSEPAPSPSATSSDATTSPSLTADPTVLSRWPADIILKTSDGKLIRTHQMILALASANVMLEKILDAECPTHDRLPLVVLEEDGATLVALLQICYALGATDVTSTELTFQQTRSVWAAAQKYSMTRIVELLRRKWMDFLHRAPLKVYLTAARQQWVVDAKEAARYCAHQTSESLVDDYVPEMDELPSTALYDLYKYIHEYHRVKANILKRYESGGDSAELPNALVAGQGRVSVADLPVIAAPLVTRHLAQIKLQCDSYGYGYILDAYTNGTRINQLVDESDALLREIQNAVSNLDFETNHDGPTNGD